ncbi:hypothetical protein BDZ90DRAFT_233097 [Jaminaea rosea]|uniref:Uncharacterized protein n=1 Tax=Jaminaea rosea TaxID=1569628 RepID=A0A316UMI2_9BASI|nr:hypothetical protein BDZ90DRAFT_233097 [Jaminaea rosea]PWN26459.1 hypothetical protein BDZ90DRAFT_233097 [Jaminaea rosea]
MLRPTLPLFSKAVRLPLNSKKANRDFYKGTRTGNPLRRTRIALMSHHGSRIQRDPATGREKTWTIMGHRLDESRMMSFVVPPGLEGCSLKPYVQRAFSPAADAEGVPHLRGGYPAVTRNKEVEEGVALGEGGLDAVSYEEARRVIWNRRS